MGLIFLQITGPVLRSSQRGSLAPAGDVTQDRRVADGGAAWIMVLVRSVLNELADEMERASPDVLDVNVSQFYGHTHLALLMRLAPPFTVADVGLALRVALSTKGLRVHITAVDEQELSAGVLPELHHYTVTWHAERFDMESLVSLSQALMEFGVDVVSSRRLTPLGQSPCWMEYQIAANVKEVDRLQQQLALVAEQLQIDLALQRDDVQRRAKRLAVFDMDSTLIKTEVIDELAVRAGVGEAVAAITERAMRGELDFRASFRERMALLKGLPVSVLQEVAEALPIMDGAATLMATLKAHGVKTAIVSGGFMYFAEHVQRMLGIDWVFANTLDVRDGVLTGTVIEPVIDAQRKVEIVRQLAADGGWDLSQVIAVGDGANDIPMLNTVGTGIAFRAKPVVREATRLALSASDLEGVLFLMGLHHRDHATVHAE
ncbi:MAG: phosphoserine phosphatase SerB [Gammaproteobacteria bacterium]